MNMVHIGPTAKSMVVIQEMILAILGTAAGDKVKIKALDILKEVSKTQNVMVSNCSFIASKSQDGDTVAIRVSDADQTSIIGNYISMEDEDETEDDAGVDDEAGM